VVIGWILYVPLSLKQWFLTGGGHASPRGSSINFQGWTSLCAFYSVESFERESVPSNLLIQIVNEVWNKEHLLEGDMVQKMLRTTAKIVGLKVMWLLAVQGKSCWGGMLGPWRLPSLRTLARWVPSRAIPKWHARYLDCTVNENPCPQK